MIEKDDWRLLKDVEFIRGQYLDLKQQMVGMLNGNKC